MMTAKDSTAVIMINMGGPDSLDDVEPYLNNIFSDPNIIDVPIPYFLRKRFARWITHKRAPKSRKIYESIGGKSPLTAITLKQARKVETILNKTSEDNYEVFAAMLYWNPLVEDVFKIVLRESFNKIIFLSLYPFYSTATTGSIEKTIKYLIQKYKTESQIIKIIDRFGDHPLFVKAISEQIIEKTKETQNEINILMSAHSIPHKRIRNGDPYQAEVEECLREIRRNTPDNVKFHLSYQSKLGPVKWLEPAPREIIKELADNGLNELWMYPLGFVADNSETLYEINILYRNIARQCGIEKFYSFEALNLNNVFIDALVDLIINAK